MTTTRRRLEQTAGPVVVLLGRLPRFVPFLLVMVVLVVGLLLKGVAGALLLAVVATLAGLLLYLSWPALQPQARLVRAAVVALVVARAVSFLL